jgi:RNA polymerase-binding protein DksA
MLSEELKNELKAKLEEEKSRLQKELGNFANPTDNPENFETKFEDFGRDEDETASEVEKYTDDLALENNLESQLKEVDDALERMAGGKYGICENCGEEIDVERLKAYPAAKICIKCKK